MDVSYPGCFVPKTIRTQVGRFVTKGWTFRTQGLDVSYPMFFCLFFFLLLLLFFFFFVFLFVFLISVFDLVFRITVDLFSLLNVGRFVPIFCSFLILDLVFFTCIYSSVCDFSRISHCKSYEMNGLAETE